MKHITVRLETKSSNHKTSFPITTSYWHELWDTYTTDFVSVEIHCWKEEPKHTQELEKIASQIEDQNFLTNFFDIGRRGTLKYDESQWDNLSLLDEIMAPEISLY